MRPQRLFIFAILLLIVGSVHASTITVPAGGNAQAAINSAQPGDTVVLEANAAFSNIILPAKPGSDYITIQSSRAGELTPGTRVSPSQSALLSKIQSTVPAEPAIKTAPGAHHYILIGLEISTATPTATIFDLIRLGDGRDVQKTLDSVPHHITIDRCYIHGFDTQNVQRGISLNSAETTISNSYISEVHGQGFDTQAIAGWNGPGPFHLINNYLEASGENIMFGGSDPALPELSPANIEIRRNYAFKPLRWNPYDQVNFRSIAGQAVTWSTNPKACLKEDPSQTEALRNRYVDAEGCIARHWTVKNLFELKNAKNVVVDGNVFENNWPDGQSGVPILFTVRNQDCSAPWSTVQNVTFTNNTVKNATGGGVNFLGLDNESLSAASNSCVGKTNPKPGSIRGDGVLVQNSLFTGIGSNFITINGFNNVRFLNNTHPDQQGNLTTLYGDQSMGFKYKNNLTNDHQYGFFGDGGTIGSAAFAKYAPDAEVTGNYIGNPYDKASYPPDNHYLGTIPLPPDFRSPFADGGANIDQLLAAQSGSAVSLPTPSPTPSVTPLPSPTATPLPSPVVTPTPSKPVTYEATYPSANSDIERQTKITAMAAQGWTCSVNPGGKFLICLRPKQ